VLRLKQILSNYGKFETFCGAPAYPHIHRGVTLDELRWQCADVTVRGIKLKSLGQVEMWLQDKPMTWARTFVGRDRPGVRVSGLFFKFIFR